MGTLPPEPSFRDDELSDGNQRWVKVPEFQVVSQGRRGWAQCTGTLWASCVLNVMAGSRPTEMDRTTQKHTHKYFMVLK